MPNYFDHAYSYNLGDWYRGCPLVVYYWTDLQSVHGLSCYGNVTRTRNVSEYMLVHSLYICELTTDDGQFVAVVATVVVSVALPAVRDARSTSCETTFHLIDVTLR